MNSETILKSERAIKDLAKCMGKEDAELLYLIKKGIENQPFYNGDFCYATEREKLFISEMIKIFGEY